MKPERCPIVPVMARWLSARVITLVLMPVVVVVLAAA